MLFNMTVDEKTQRGEHFERAHREHGLPVTMQRLAVFEDILEREDHPTADQVFQSVCRKLPQISRMTVYRILATFVSLGLVTRICHPGSVARFDPKLSEHHHLVCRECGCIIDLDATKVKNVSWPEVGQYGFQIEDYQIHFRGRCSRCQRATNEADAIARLAGAESRKPQMKRKSKSKE